MRATSTFWVFTIPQLDPISMPSKVVIFPRTYQKYIQTLLQTGKELCNFAGWSVMEKTWHVHACQTQDIQLYTHDYNICTHMPQLYQAPNLTICKLHYSRVVAARMAEAHEPLWRLIEHHHKKQSRPKWRQPTSAANYASQNYPEIPTPCNMEVEKNQIWETKAFLCFQRAPNVHFLLVLGRGTHVKSWSSGVLLKPRWNE